MILPSRGHTNRGGGGASLVEVLLAALLLTVAFLSFAELFELSTMQTMTSRNGLLARRLAVALFDVYRVRPGLVLCASRQGAEEGGDLLAGDGLRGLLLAGDTDLAALIGAAGMRVKLEVTRPLAALPGLHRVDLRVSWKERGHERLRSYARLLSL